MSRRKRIESQLRSWLDGKSVHNTVDNECCPDFSCCNSANAASLEERKKFFNADERERQKMLVGFLVEAFESLGVEVEVSR